MLKGRRTVAQKPSHTFWVSTATGRHRSSSHGSDATDFTLQRCSRIAAATDNNSAQHPAIRRPHRPRHAASRQPASLSPLTAGRPAARLRPPSWLPRHQHQSTGTCSKYTVESGCTRLSNQAPQKTHACMQPCQRNQHPASCHHERPSLLLSHLSRCHCCCICWKRATRSVLRTPGATVLRWLPPPYASR